MKQVWEIFYLKRELIVFAGDMRKEKWFIEGKGPTKHHSFIDVEIRRATKEDLDKFSEIVPKKKLKKFKNWFRNNHICFIALKDGKIIYYQWLAFSNFYNPYINKEFELQKDEVYPIDLFTLPEYRMKNLHLAVDSQVFTYCKDMMRFKLLATASPDKFPMFQIMYKRAGWGNVYPLRSITYMRVLGIKKHKIKKMVDDKIPEN